MSAHLGISSGSGGLFDEVHRFFLRFIQIADHVESRLRKVVYFAVQNAFESPLAEAPVDSEAAVKATVGAALDIACTKMETLDLEVVKALEAEAALVMVAAGPAVSAVQVDSAKAAAMEVVRVSVGVSAVEAVAEVTEVQEAVATVAVVAADSEGTLVTEVASRTEAATVVEPVTEAAMAVEPVTEVVSVEV